MTGFHDVLFPAPWARAASGGPERRTDIVRLRSGAERRIGLWARARRRWDLGGLVLSLADLEALIGFFEAREGRLFSFRFQDLTDWRSAPAGQAISAMDQALGAADGETDRFWLKKAYGDAGNQVVRDIVCPRADSLHVAVDGQTVGSEAYALHAGGEVQFFAPPPNGAVLTAGFTFDCVARFDADRLDYALEGPNAARLHALNLLEVGTDDVRSI